MHTSDSDERCVSFRALPFQCLSKPLCVALIVQLPFSALRCRYSCGGGEGLQLHKERDLPLVTRFADSYSTYGVAILPLSHMLTINHKLACAATRQLGFPQRPRAIVEPDERPFSTGLCLQVLSCTARLSRIYPVH